MHLSIQIWLDSGQIKLAGLGRKYCIAYEEFSFKKTCKGWHFQAKLL